MSYALVLGMLSSLTPFLMVGTAPVAEASPDPGWYNPNWTYRRPVTINNPGSALTDYQVLVTNPVYDETGLVGSWHFNEGSGTTAYDSSGRGNNGTLVNGPSWVDGKYGKALEFDGEDDLVSVPHHASLNFGAGDYTLEFWFKWRGTPRASGGFITKQGYWSVPTPFTFWGRPNSMLVGVGSGKEAQGEMRFNTGGEDGKWHHLVLTRTGETITVYVDTAYKNRNCSPLRLN